MCWNNLGSFFSVPDQAFPKSLISSTKGNRVRVFTQTQKGRNDGRQE